MKLKTPTRTVHVLAATALASLAAAALAANGPSDCQAAQEGGAILVDAQCVDADFSTPVIDSRAEVEAPVKGLKVTGHFKDQGKFVFFFPAKPQWSGRFYQLVYPNTEQVSDDVIRFGAADGAYTVHTVSSGGYRLDAAAAKLAKSLAADYYGHSGKVFGYVYGGSGGSYQAIAAAENTVGVWDGAVPFVVGIETSIPNNFFVRAFARLVLRDKAQQIAEAVRPGGSGDPYRGLDAVEKSVLQEVSAMGVPLRGWDNFSYVLGLQEKGGLLGFLDMVRQSDPTYAEDFWTRPGYLGTERSALGERVRAARVSYSTALTAVEVDAQAGVLKLALERLPPQTGFMPVEIRWPARDGKPAGSVLAMFDAPSQRLQVELGAEASKALTAGAKVSLDNAWPLALTTYYRHQVPRGEGFAAWRQFRAADGTPIYPQRANNVGEGISRGVSGGGSHSGAIRMKMIAISNTLDVDAFAWHGDWYRGRVERALGERSRNDFRLWINDNADHLDGRVIASGPADSQHLRLINFNGIVEQALRDVSAWAERGVPPAETTAYRLRDGQVALPADAGFIGGIQPLVRLTVNGAPSVRVRPGAPVVLDGVVEVPPGAGTVVALEWSEQGGAQTVTEPVEAGHARRSAQRTVSYAQPGTYYPVFKATARRAAGADARYGQVSNLARVKVVVE